MVDAALARFADASSLYLAPYSQLQHKRREMCEVAATPSEAFSSIVPGLPHAMLVGFEAGP